ncbi:Hypothetical protein D9617_13g100180 [Elsinoe fawcettii]|nr:Hypothetical protein D9617_13g100180 [Elsinoe fawcettii]
MDQNSTDSVTAATALAALIISLLALVIALGQLAQQVSSTAEGTRRCNEKTIGPWSKLTEWHWRVTEFRYEVLFTTPEIFIYPNSDTEDCFDTTRDERVYFLDDKLPKSIDDAWRLPPEKCNTLPDYSVTWINLLRLAFAHHDRRVGDLSQKFTPFLTDSSTSTVRRQAVVPEIAVRMKQRSWDSMPPDVVTPLAKTTLGSLAIIACRLGMDWKEWKPTTGVLRAEGSGMSLSSMRVSGIGTVVRFSMNKRSLSNFSYHAASHLPSVMGDKMIFGIVPACTELGLSEDIHLINDDRSKDMEAIYELLSLPNHVRASLNLEDFLLRSPINDLLCLYGPFPHIIFSSPPGITHPLPWPEEPLGHTIVSPFLHAEGRYIIGQRLAAEYGPTTSDHSQLKYVNDKWQHLQKTFPRDFFNWWNRAAIRPVTESPNTSDDRSTRVAAAYTLHTALKNIHDNTTSYFQHLCTQRSSKDSREDDSLTYDSILRARFISAVAAAKTVQSKKGSGQLRTCEDLRKLAPDVLPDMCELAHCYVDNVLPVFGQTLRDRHASLNLTDLHIKEIWWTLMLRGLTWRMSVWSLIPAKGTVMPLPSSYYDSQVPVWIE